MVRKTTRSAMKAAEQAKNDLSRQDKNKTSTQRRRSSSRGNNSEEDLSQSSTKHLSPNRADKGSSENESDTDSKKPLKKRNRSMGIKEETKPPSSHKSRWDKQHKSPPAITAQQDNEEEVNEEQNSKGKSINKNNSNNDNVVNPETESENVQVTDESPTHAKDVNQEDEAKNGKDNIEIGVDISKTSSELTSDQQSEQTLQAEEESQRETKSPSKEKTDKHVDKHNISNRRGSRERRSSERSRDSDKEHSENKNSSKNEDTKRIKLKRPSRDKRTSESDEKDEKKGERGTRKKITLKRPENKPVSSEESKQQVENHGSSPKEQSQVEEWNSSYEVNNEETHNKIDEKPSRKRITLNRLPVEDSKTSTTEKNSKSASEKTDILVRRSVSLSEHKEERRKSTSESTTPDGKKRRSSAFEIATSEEKAPSPKKPTKVVKLNRHISQDPQEPLPPGEEALKKYKWGQSDLSHTDVETLNLEALKQVCPTIEFLEEDEVNLEVDIKEKKIKEKRKTFTELEEEEMEKIEAELNAEPEEMEIKENIIAMNRKISIVDDTASKMRPPPSPARNPVSEVLFITNLVRPFTVKQLKELLERTGKIRDDGFWTDRIKSKCYVYYETVEEAEATRNALHGVNWPIGNGKKLIIDYATVDDLENAKNPPVIVKKEKSPEKENKKPIIEEEKDDNKNIRTVKREWDLGKEEDRHRRRSRSRSGERQRKHSRRSYTPVDYHNKKRKHEEPAPQKAMDDLFLKTKATPSIYWQPLSPEEIAQKQQQRQARLEENKRRLEEISRTATRGTHRDRGRDRNFRRR